MPADAKSPKKLRNNRAALTHKAGYALRHPGRVVPYLRRAGRDAWLRLIHPDQAHSVFSHPPLEVIDQCLAHVGRVLTDTGLFDFTFDRTETLLALARRHGLHARFMEDWEKRPHGQSKTRVSRSPLPTA